MPHYSIGQLAVLNVLKTGPKTTWDLMNATGLVSVAARICELRQTGVPIKSKLIPHERQDGTMVNISLYWLADEECVL